MGVSKNNGTPKSSISIGFSIINHPLWGTPIFGNIHIHYPDNLSKPKHQQGFEPRDVSGGAAPRSHGKHCSGTGGNGGSGGGPGGGDEGKSLVGGGCSNWKSPSNTDNIYIYTHIFYHTYVYF